MINSFKGQYDFLSNFHPAEVEYEGLLYPTTEHAFQAAKTLNPLERKMVAGCKTPGDAKRFGRRLLLRPDWEEVKVQVMRDVLWEKFGEDPDMGALLLRTGHQDLVEGNNWHDTFWGVCDGTCKEPHQPAGENNLGKLLMALRKHLREREAVIDDLMETEKPPQLFNKHHGQTPAGAVNIMRPSKWANPYSHLEDSAAEFKVASREEAVKAYARHIMTQPGLIAAARAELKGRDLECCCAPAACHGDILLRVANGEDVPYEVLPVTPEPAQPPKGAAPQPVSFKRVTVKARPWLEQRFGDHYCQISVDTTLKLKSSVKDVSRSVRGEVPEDIEVLTKQFLEPPQGITDKDFIFGYKNSEGDDVEGSIKSDGALQAYIAKYPKDWEMVQKLLGIVRQKSRHACAFVIANKPIHEFIPLTEVGKVRATQYTPASVEAAGGLKMDFLVINSLNDIQLAIKLIQKRSGIEIPESTIIAKRKVPAHRLVPLKDGTLVDIWDLPEDQSVFREVSEGKTETVFQFNTPGAVQYLRNFAHWKNEDEGRKAIDSIEAMSAFTALDRPGPLDAYVEQPDGRKHNMLVEFARRARGDEAIGSLPVFMELFPETYGVLTYQEQLQKAYKNLTGCSGPEAEDFRTNVAKKKMDKVDKAFPGWMERVGPKLGEDVAKNVWQTFKTWGQYGFNKSHSVCYVVIAYACAYLKKHYPLEWWCAVLSNADKNEVTETFWTHCGHLVDLPDVNRSGSQFEIRGDRILAPVSLIKGVGENAHKELLRLAPYRDITDFCEKIEADRVVNKKPSIVKATGLQKVTKKGELCWRKGTSSLKRNVVHKLIAAGVMDSLFPADLELSERIFAFETALSKARGEKKVSPVPAKFATHDPVRDFLLRKEVLPIYNADLMPLLKMGDASTYPFSALRFGGKYTTFRWGNGEIPVVDYNQLRRLNAKTPWPENTRITVAIPVYVVERRCFQYPKKTKEKEACELTLEIEGIPHEYVRWPDKKTGKIPEVYQKQIGGSIGLAFFTRYTEKRPFSLDDVTIFHMNPAAKGKDDDEEEDD